MSWVYKVLFRKEAKMAKAIVGVSRGFAIGSFVPFLNKFPILQKLREENPRMKTDWDFFLTMAISSYSVPQIIQKGSITQKGYNLLYTLIIGEFKKEEKNAQEAFYHLRDHAKTWTDAKNPHIAFGTWVVWNLLGEGRTGEEDLKLILALSELIKKSPQQLLSTLEGFGN